MRSPSTCVTVPVAATVKSPFSRTAPMASPGWNGLTVGDAGVAPVEAAVEPDVEPIGTAMKPMASRYLPKRGIVSGAKLPRERGTAIGFDSPVESAGRAAQSFVA